MKPLRGIVVVMSLVGVAACAPTSGSTTGTGGAPTVACDPAMGTGGGGGGGRAGSVGEVVPPASIAGMPNADGAMLMDSFILMPCLAIALQDCVTGTGPSPNGALPYEQQGLTTSEVFPLGGTPGTMYNLTISVNGISEAKYYTGGTRAGGSCDPVNPDAANGTDTFYTGGQPVNSKNNVYKFIVKDAGGAELQHYYLNSFPGPADGSATSYESHLTFPIAFTHDIPVPGGGSFTFYTADRNYRTVDNCGIGYRPTACAVAEGRMVPNEPDLVVPASYLGQSVTSLNTRNGPVQPFHSQIFHIVVTGVTTM